MNLNKYKNTEVNSDGEIATQEIRLQEIALDDEEIDPQEKNDINDPIQIDTGNRLVAGSCLPPKLYESDKDKID